VEYSLLIKIEEMKKQFFALSMLLLGMTAHGQSGVYQSAYFDSTHLTGVLPANTNLLSNGIYPVLTVEAWAKLDTNDNNVHTLLSSTGLNTMISLDTILYICTYMDSIYVNYGSYTVSALYPTDTQWHHIAVIFDTSGYSLIAPPYWTSYDSIAIYIDGSYVTSMTGSFMIKSFIDDGVFDIGSFSGTDFWNGHISKIVMSASVLYTTNFTPDCVFDTIRFTNDTISPPTLLVFPLNGNDTAYFSYVDTNIYYGGGGTGSIFYTYMTSPCAPTYTFYRSVSHDTITATNHNNSYMKGAHAATHINGWDNALGTTWVTCPYSTYGAFTDMLLVDTTIDSIYFYTDSYHNDTAMTDTVTIPLITQVSMINASQDGNVYPNPTNQLLTIQSSLLINKIELIDLAGQVVISERPNKKVCNLDLNALNQGIYLLKVNDAYTMRVIKE